MCEWIETQRLIQHFKMEITSISIQSPEEINLNLIFFPTESKINLYF